MEKDTILRLASIHAPVRKYDVPPRRRQADARAQAGFGSGKFLHGARNMNGAAMTETTWRTGGDTTVQRRYFISSLPARADRIPGAVREYCGVENGLERAPFGEGGSVVRVGHAGGEHVDAAAIGAESDERGEVAENRGGG